MRDFSYKMQQMRNFSCKNQGREPGRSPPKNAPTKCQLNFAPNIFSHYLRITKKNQFIFKVFSSEKNSFELFSNLKDILLLFSPLPVRLPQWSSRPWQDLLQQAKSYVLGTFRDDGKLTSYGFDKIGDEFVMFWVMMKMIINWKRKYFWISNVWLAEIVINLFLRGRGKTVSNYYWACDSMLLRASIFLVSRCGTMFILILSRTQPSRQVARVGSLSLGCCPNLRYRSHGPPICAWFEIPPVQTSHHFARVGSLSLWHGAYTDNAPGPSCDIARVGSLSLWHGAYSDNPSAALLWLCARWIAFVVARCSFELFLRDLGTETKIL